MEIYKPSTQLAYIIEADGDSWFAHYSDFTNLQESNEYAFGKTPKEALQNFIDSRHKAMNNGEHISTNEFTGEIING